MLKGKAELMAKKVTIETLGNEVKKILNEYGEDVTTNLSQITKAIGSKGASALRNESHEKFGGERYYKGWGYTVEPGRLYTRVIIHNKKLPGLPHLLEFGHAKVGGGRVEGRAHIAPVESELIKEYENEVKSKL